MLPSLAPSPSPCPLGPCLPLARSGQRSLQLWWLHRLALASEAPLLPRSLITMGRALTHPDIEPSLQLESCDFAPCTGS